MVHEIGDTLRLLRSEKCASLETVAEAIGVSVSAIEHYENNTWCPGKSVLEKLAAFFGVTVAEIENGYSVMFDHTTRDMLIVRQMSGNQISIVSRTKIYY